MKYVSSFLCATVFHLEVFLFYFLKYSADSGTPVAENTSKSHSSAVRLQVHHDELDAFQDLRNTKTFLAEEDRNISIYMRENNEHLAIVVECGVDGWV